LFFQACFDKLIFVAQPIEELRKIRLDKLAKIKELGINPYSSVCERKQTISQALKMMGKEVAVAGRVMAMRGHGGIQFFDLRDESGKIQLVFKKENLKPQSSKLLLLLDIGDFLDAQGEIFKTKAGEISVLVKDFHLLTKSLRPLPSKWHGLSDIEERYRQRYVDLIMNPEVRKVFEIRKQIIDELRVYLNKNGAFEVETPILQPIYGGATARPFITHHNALNCDFYLRISDELYLKRLIGGGFEFVYEFGKDFRNEGIDRQHNPEFTMLEFYWAWKNYNDLMKFTEEMISDIVKKIKGSYEIKYQGDALDFTAPWRRMTFREAVLKESGVDIGKVDTEEKLRAEIKKQQIKLDLKGVAGYGALLDAFYKQLVRPNIIGPVIIYDWPVEMVPLAKRKKDNLRLVESFQPLVKGMELLLAYSELNDPIDQRGRWEEEMKLGRKGLEEHQVVDEDYIRALEYGLPPLAGWGMGIDRFTKILADQPTLKDVILFPTLRPKSQP
jgi:lysyl-tRNA synthetase class 2